MANDLNQCNFIGRLGADPDSRHLQSGDAVTNFRLAVGWKSKDKDGTEWVNIVTFGRLAEICAEYLRKGSQVFVSGKIRNRKWQDQSGQDRYTTEIVCNEMQMIGGREGGKPAQYEPSKQTRDDFDDDIPF